MNVLFVFLISASLICACSILCNIIIVLLATIVVFMLLIRIHFCTQVDMCECTIYGILVHIDMG